MRFLSVAMLAFACVHRVEPPSGVAYASAILASDGTVVGVGGATAKGKFLCEPEMTVGSHIPTSVCRYVDDDKDTRLHRDQLRDAMNALETGVCVPTGGTCNGGGGGAK